MYTISEPTVTANPKVLFSSKGNPMTNHAQFTDQSLWVDDIFVGKISLNDSHAKLQLGENSPLSIAREDFTELFNREAHLVEFIYHANEVNHVKLNFLPSNKAKTGDFIHSVRLFHETPKGPRFYGELSYWKR